MNDTIAAIATALGSNAISIIRVSGEDSIEKVEKIFKGKKLSQVPTHTIHYGHIVDNDKIVDEVLVTVMRSPKTYTTENIVEINCHGGIAATNHVFQLLLSQGIRVAEPGEFTKRAFLNGRVDLLKAEAVMDVINAKTEPSLQLAINQVSGRVSSQIHDLRNSFSEIISHIEVNIDYPEYEDVTELTNEDIKPKLLTLKEKMESLLKESKVGKIIKEGITTCIIGRPNVGKSSLLNCLLEEEKAIVTDVAGTTRDIVEGTISIDGILLNIIDTAGIRQTDDLVESIGVKKSLEYMEKAELILFVLNQNEPLTKEEEEIFEKLKGKNYLLVMNKSDLKQKMDFSLFPKDRMVIISTLTGSGISELKKKIKELFHLNQIEQQDFTYLSNARSIALLKESIRFLENAIQGIEEEYPIDMVELDIRYAWEKLGEITGETYKEELLDQLFSRFCLGK